MKIAHRQVRKWNPIQLKSKMVSHLKRLDELLALVVPNVNVAIVERHEHPLFSRMKVARLHSV